MAVSVWGLEIIYSGICDLCKSPTATKNDNDASQEMQNLFPEV